jgi:hypothetical protein
MSSTGKFILKLSFLVVPFLILSLVLHDGPSGASVGGGGYDLSGLVYGSMLFAVIMVWLMWMLISYSRSKTAIDKKLHLRLLMIGLTALIAAWFVTPKMF